MGLLSTVFLLLVAGFSDSVPTGLRMLAAGAAGFFILWTLASLLPALGALIVFTRLIEKTSGIE